jgi:hypothetical protein
MDGYFVVAPPPVMVHAPYAPEATPWANSYQINQSLIHSFWSVRDLWLEEYWTPQSEVACASFTAQALPPAITPWVSQVMPVVMLSW